MTLPHPSLLPPLPSRANVYTWGSLFSCYQDESATDPPVSSSSSSALQFEDTWSNNQSSRIKQDVFHIMDRLTSHMAKTHPLFRTFVSRMRDAFFILDKDDIIAVRQRLAERGFGDSVIDELYELNYKYFVRRCRRHVPGPADLLSNFDELINVFANARDTKTGRPLFSDKVKDAIKNVRIHIQNGCVSDPPQCPMYFEGGAGVRTVRQTSQLEGFHNPLFHMFGSAGCNCRLGHLLTMDFAFKWNVDRGVEHRGDFDFGHYEHWRMHDVQDLWLYFHDKPLFPGFADPRCFEDTNEEFGVTCLDPNRAPVAEDTPAWRRRFEKATDDQKWFCRRMRLPAPMLNCHRPDEGTREFFRNHLNNFRTKKVDGSFSDAVKFADFAAWWNSSDDALDHGSVTPTMLSKLYKDMVRLDQQTLSYSTIRGIDSRLKRALRHAISLPQAVPAKQSATGGTQRHALAHTPRGMGAQYHYMVMVPEPKGVRRSPACSKCHHMHASPIHYTKKGARMNIGATKTQCCCAKSEYLERNRPRMWKAKPGAAAVGDTECFCKLRFLKAEAKAGAKRKVSVQAASGRASKRTTNTRSKLPPPDRPSESSSGSIAHDKRKAPEAHQGASTTGASAKRVRSQGSAAVGGASLQLVSIPPQLRSSIQAAFQQNGCSMHSVNRAVDFLKTNSCASSSKYSLLGQLTSDKLMALLLTRFGPYRLLRAEDLRYEEVVADSSQSVQASVLGDNALSLSEYVASHGKPPFNASQLRTAREHITLLSRKADMVQLFIIGNDMLALDVACMDLLLNVSDMVARLHHATLIRGLETKCSLNPPPSTANITCECFRTPSAPELLHAQQLLLGLAEDDQLLDLVGVKSLCSLIRGPVLESVLDACMSAMRPCAARAGIQIKDVHNATRDVSWCEVGKRTAAVFWYGHHYVAVAIDLDARAFMLYNGLSDSAYDRYNRPTVDAVRKRLSCTYPGVEFAVEYHSTPQQTDGVSCALLAMSWLRDWFHGIDTHDHWSQQDAQSLRLQFLHMIVRTHAQRTQ